jgi:ATP-binding cassette subfamily C (CFTR/MRP) protein 10
VVSYEETKDQVEEEARKQGMVELGVYKWVILWTGVRCTIEWR